MSVHHACADISGASCLHECKIQKIHILACFVSGGTMYAAFNSYFFDYSGAGGCQKIAVRFFRFGI
jgi:hypothetical protein